MVMETQFLTVNDKDNLAFVYESNGFVAPKPPQILKKFKGGRIVQRLEEIFEDDTPKEKPLVFMVHDFPDAAHMRGLDDLFGVYAKLLKQDGFPTLRFDFRGCGESDGRQQDFCFDTAVNDLKALMHWAKTEHGHDRIIMIATGLGASIAVQGFDPDIVCAMVLLWPVLKPMDTPLKAIDDLHNRQFIAEHDYMQFGDHRIGLLLANEMRQTDLIPYLEKIKCPVQIQQGTCDKYAPYEHLEMAKEHIKGIMDVGVFEDGDHYLTDPGMHKQMIRNTLYFLNKYAYRKVPSKIKDIDKKKIFRSQK